MRSFGTVDLLKIEHRFRGPTESGNGGYACGALAGFVDSDPVEVTLRLPPPLETPLAVEGADMGGVRLLDGEALVAEARPIAAFDLAIPSPVSVDEAAAARSSSPFRHDHPFPECFVCGPARHGGDGLGLTCGPLDGGVVAATWEVGGSLPGAAAVAPEIVWSALDCPGGLSAMLLQDIGVCVLGRMAARVHGPIEPGTTCVAMGWPIERDGRKLFAGSAIFSADGELLADARATWVELAS